MEEWAELYLCTRATDGPPCRPRLGQMSVAGIKRSLCCAALIASDSSLLAALNAMAASQKREVNADVQIWNYGRKSRPVAINGSLKFLY